MAPGFPVSLMPPFPSSVATEPGSQPLGILGVAFSVQL